MSEVLEGLDTSGRHVLPVFITIDPARDTPARLKSYFETSDFHKRSITRAAPAPHPRRTRAAPAPRLRRTRAAPAPQSAPAPHSAPAPRRRVIALTGSHEALQKACRAYRVYFTRPTPEEVARGDYLLDHSIITITLALALALALALTLTLTLTLTPTLTLTLTRWHVATTC